MSQPLRRPLEDEPFHCAEHSDRPEDRSSPRAGFPFLIAVPPLPEPATGDDDGIPDPDPTFVRALAVQGFEVVEGTRSISQLGALITVGAARSLIAQRTSLGDRRRVYRDTRQRRPLATTVRVDRPQEAVAEAAVVLRTRERSHAVAARLEWSHGHWRASELIVL